MVKISLIIPVYNAEKYLPTCLDSVANQTYQDWQAICVNDGSSDKSADVLKKYADKDRRFIIVNQQNQGVSSARNNGLAMAEGDFVMFLDNDDYIHPKCFEVCVEAMEKSSADICQFNYKNVDEEEELCFDEIATGGGI